MTASEQGWTCPDCGIVCLHARSVHTPDVCAKFKAEESAQQQPGTSEQCPHTSETGDGVGSWVCDGCGAKRPDASERGESAILNCVVDYEITSLCQNTKLIADLRARLADAKKQRDYWLNLYHEIEDAKAEVEIERDAAQREAQALREGNERLLQALGIYGEHLDSCWLRQTNITAVGQSRCNCGYFAAVGKALASTDRGGRDGELTDG